MAKPVTHGAPRFDVGKKAETVTITTSTSAITAIHLYLRPKFHSPVSKESPFLSRCQIGMAKHQ